MNITKQEMIEYVTWVLNKPAFPASPQQSLLNNKEEKQPAYYKGKNYFVGVEWKKFQNWHDLDYSLQKQLIRTWHADSRIEGVSTLGGFNGRHWLGWTDFDVKDFSSPEQMDNEIATWLEKYQIKDKAPQFKTPSGGYRVLIAFEKEPDGWGANNGFALQPNQTNRCGELLTKNGGHTLLPSSKGSNGILYMWTHFDGRYPPVFESPESVGLYKIVAAPKTYPAPNNNQRTHPPFAPLNKGGWGDPDYAEVDKRAEAEACLEYIDPDLHYDDWLKVGAALYSIDPNLESEFDRWSRGGNKYKDSKDIATKWRSFSNGTKADIGSLVHMAKAGGFDASAWCKQWHKENGSQRTMAGTTTKIKNGKDILGKEAAIAEARKILEANHDELTKNLLLEEVREKAKISPNTWEFKFIRPLQKDRKTEQLKLEVNTYTNELDPYKRVMLKQRICSNYGISSSDLECLAVHSEQQQLMSQKTIYYLDEFLNLETEAEDWVVPSVLPQGEMLLLAANAKVGKSLLVTDLAHAVLSGGKFLNETAKQGRVLYIGSDESCESLKRRLYLRGFDLEENQRDMKIMTEMQITNLTLLEQELEDFRPDLVVLDSLTSITLELGISENSTEFARSIYRVSKLFKRYNVASVMIHHENKNTDAKGINKVAGSGRIPAAVWGIAQLWGDSEGKDNDSDLVTGTRWLRIKPREGEQITHVLEINPKDKWTIDGIYQYKGDTSDPKGEKKTIGDKVLKLLKEYKPRGLEFQEIDNILSVGRTLYSVLDRLCDRKLVSKRRSTNDARRWVYALPVEN